MVYNRHRIHSAIGYMTPDEFAARWEETKQKRWQTDNEDKKCAENVAETVPKNRDPLHSEITYARHYKAYKARKICPPNERNSDLVCLFCGTATSRDEPREHIFPKSMGGDAVMPIGDVCRNCNTALSDLERSLKRENPVMAESYQIDDFQKGGETVPNANSVKANKRNTSKGRGLK